MLEFCLMSRQHDTLADAKSLNTGIGFMITLTHDVVVTPTISILL